jgi:predicted RNA methylase
MRIELDQYFTPEKTASILLEKASFTDPEYCLDPTCGSGNLLSAANKVHESTKCIGIDRDRKIITKLRKENPNWLLSVADMQSESSYMRTLVASNFKVCDALLLNPPFSQVKSKHLDINYKSSQFKCSVAMSYIMKSLELFSPVQGALVIAPESLLYSELDEQARDYLAKEYNFQSICNLENKTFRGAKVHASVFKLLPRLEKPESKAVFRTADKEIKASIVRGGAQVHIVNQTRHYGVDSVPFIHTKMLPKLFEQGVDEKKRTIVKVSGRIQGYCIVLPRVGVPKRDFTKTIKIEEEVQLSDCIFAIQGEYHDLKSIEMRINHHWQEFYDLYKGTGARYITLSKLKRWLITKQISAF